MGDGAGGRLLWLLRHAATKSDPPHGGTDHDRTLTKAGRRDAESLGRRLASDGLGFAPEELPRLVLCSTARRAVQTAEPVVEALSALEGEGARLDLRRRLYHASPEEVLDEVGTADDALRAVMVVGHNPTVHQLAMAMIADADEAGRRSLGDGRFPTCALAVYRLDAARWRDLSERTGTVAGWFAPPYGE